MTKSPAFRSVFVAEREVRRLGKDRDRFSRECRRLQGRLDAIVPHYETLKQASSDSRGNFGVSSSLLTLGGVAIGVAGAIADPTWKAALLWSGLATAACGFLMAGYTMSWVKPARPTGEVPRRPSATVDPAGREA